MLLQIFFSVSTVCFIFFTLCFQNLFHCADALNRKQIFLSIQFKDLCFFLSDFHEFKKIFFIIISCALLTTILCAYFVFLNIFLGVTFSLLSIIMFVFFLIILLSALGFCVIYILLILFECIYLHFDMFT